MIKESGLENKEVVSILDEIRKNYHNRKNIGDKTISEKDLSTMVANIFRKNYPLSKDKKYVFYQGGWRKLYGAAPDRYIVYLKSNTPVTFKKK